ncbi:MAG: winged helix-turn-helix domain-containing protein [Nanoarchaeota archaeon]
MKKRERLDVIKDILQAIKNNNGKIKPTRLLSSSNLSSLLFKEYIKELLESKLIDEIKDKKGKKYYVVLEKGDEFLVKYFAFNRFVNDLGL